MNNHIILAQKIINIEARSIFGLINQLDANFENTINTILNSNGKVIVIGMGKSGLIGRKIAATLASTGTPSFFIHPAEAFHGDLGMIEKHDVIIAISYSGETDELLKLIPFFRKNGNITISLTKNKTSTLAKNTTYHISTFVKEEACPYDLAPTSSTTAALVIGDALAIVLMKGRNFKPEDFAEFHPGGSLGKRLLSKVNDLMTSENIPTNQINDGLNDIIYSISQGRLGLTVVVDNSDKVLGLITDGELRRTMHRIGKNIFDYKATDLMNPEPECVLPNERLSKAEEIMKRTKYRTLLVVDKEKTLIGILDISVIQYKL